MSTPMQAVVPFHRDADAIEDKRARRRFAAIVRALSAFAAAMRPRATAPVAVPVAELPDEPTRRGNRLRRLFGRLNRRPLQGGKSRPRTR